MMWCGWLGKEGGGMRRGVWVRDIGLGWVERREGGVDGYILKRYMYGVPDRWAWISELDRIEIRGDCVVGLGDSSC